MSEYIQVVMVAGIAGVGKTTVGRFLAADLGWNFCEGDDFHPPGNLKKMMAGVPLTDEDRWPWLEGLKTLVHTAVREEKSLVVACSLLKESYRRYLIDDLDPVRVVFLTADEHLVKERLGSRSPHYFPKELLQSQLEAWEEPKEGLTVDASQGLEEIIAEIKKKLRLAG
jgi:gluconokinase